MFWLIVGGLIFALSLLRFKFSFLLFALGICISGFVLKDDWPYAFEENKVFKGTCAYIINLDRSKDRWAHALSVLEPTGLNIERIEAVDGSFLEKPFLEKIIDTKTMCKMFKGKVMGKGAIGCFLSHIKAWKSFLASGYAYALICEDDITFNAKEVRGLVDLLTKNKDYEKLFDICTFDSGVRKGLPLPLAQLSSKRNLVVYLRTVMSAGCYLINRHAATKLLEKAFPLRMPIDNYFSRSWELGCVFTGIHPKPVHQTYGYHQDGTKVSDIDQRAREHQKEPENLRNILSKNLFSFSSGVLRFVYNAWYAFYANFL